jgi:hypothetical protein
MSENAKTVTFVVIGLLAIGLGLITRPRSAEVSEETLVGVDLTKNFNSPEDAKRLRIVRFNEDTATLSEFEVAEQDGLWSIPSKDGYPADAARQMAEAATSLMDRKILQVASKNAGDHEQFGVIDPLSPKLEPGQLGVGTRVTMKNADDKPLVDLIVGKAVRDAEGQRYVRESGRDVTYVIEIDPAKLSTNFEDWIEKDLLKLNGWDLKNVQVKDYSAELVPVMTQDGRFTIQPTWDPRAEMTFDYNDADAKWAAASLKSFDPKQGENGDYVEFKLAEDEELNTETLNGLKTALDDLQIVDVVRKPKGLSENLKAGQDFVNNRDAMKELMSKGFTPAKVGGGAADDIISSDGEVIATMKNGAEYVLRFGNLTSAAGGEAAGAEAADPAKQASAASGENKGDDHGVNRYLFVMARFNEAAVKQPELEKLPELPAGAAAPAGESKDAGGTPANQPAEPPAPPADQAAQPEGTTPETPKADADKGAESGEKPADAAAAPAADKPADAAKTEEAAKSDAAKPEGAAPAADAPKNEEIEKVMAERKRIEQENQKKNDEYQELVKKGKESVKDLNLRFGDWYFVVDDSVFKKIRLSRENVVKKKEAAKKEGEAATTPAPGGAIPGLPAIPGATK